MQFSSEMNKKPKELEYNAKRSTYKGIFLRKVSATMVEMPEKYLFALLNSSSSSPSPLEKTVIKNLILPTQPRSPLISSTAIAQLTLNHTATNYLT